MTQLFCALCLLTRSGLGDPALTMINGTAVCLDHAKSMRSGDFASVLAYLQDRP